ncbi:MAG: hypothetical protein KAY46_04285 [Burkholderiaceae bacterium]|nr:hypothetical protein [Burkholderiaceae bacterium]
MDSTAVAGVLARLVSERGVQLAGQPDMLRGLLLDELPGARRDVAALVQAAADGLVDELQRSAAREPIVSLIRRLAVRLSTDHPIAIEQALSTVFVWARALGLADDAVHVRLQASGDDAHEGGGTGIERGDDPSRLAIRLTRSFQSLAGALAGRLARPRQRWAAIAVVTLLLAGFGYLGLRSPGSIRSVEFDEPFIADNKPRKLWVVTGGTTKPVAQIRVEVLRGDWANPKWTVNVPDDQAGGARLPAGTLTSRARRDNDNEFAFILVFSDGSESKPFLKRFEIKALSITPPRIASTSASGPFLVGRHTFIRIAYATGNADIVKVRRKVLRSDVGWKDAQGRTIDVEGHKGKTSGTIEYLVSPNDTGKAVFEFVLIDADGNETAPARFEFEVLKASGS